MALSTQPYKGARDFYPEDFRRQRWMFGVCKQVLENFGYERYDAPIFEPAELYKAKSSDEIVSQQTYAFTDRGGREIVIRPEMTPTVSRMVAARRQELAYPLRLYNIGGRWRYERPQKGRFREFFQLDVDMFGVENLNAEVEMIQIADTIFKRFGASSSDYEIRINSRQLLNEIIAASQPRVETNQVVGLIDHYDKLAGEEFASKLAELVENPSALTDFLAGGQPNAELEELAQKCANLGIETKFVPSLARGFNYYTDIVFEAFDKSPDNNRSLFGGGRYDGLVGKFGVEPLPTIGFAIGDASFMEFLLGHNLVPELTPETDLYVALAGDVDASAVLAELRKELNVAVDYTGRKLDKQIKSASRKGIKWLLVIGKDELKSGEYNLKNLETGTQENLEIQDIAVRIKPDNFKY